LAITAQPKYALRAIIARSVMLDTVPLPETVTQSTLCPIFLHDGLGWRLPDVPPLRYHVAGIVFARERSGGEGAPTAWATLPPGTTAVGHSVNCAPWQENDPAAEAKGPYVCSLPGIIVPKGQVTNFSLTLRADDVVTHAKGGVQLLWGARTRPTPTGPLSIRTAATTPPSSP
jgi:hypothetical protein